MGKGDALITCRESRKAGNHNARKGQERGEFTETQKLKKCIHRAIAQGSDKPEQKARYRVPGERPTGFKAAPIVILYPWSRVLRGGQ